MHKRMKPLFSFNFHKGIVSNRLRFSLICTLLFFVMFATTTAEGQIQKGVVREEVEDVDPDTPGDQPGFVATFDTEGYEEGEFEDVISDLPLFFVNGEYVTYDEYPGPKSFEDLGDGMYALRIGGLPSNENSPPSESPTDNSPTSPSPQEHSTTPATSTGNGAIASGNIGVTTPAPQPLPPRVATLRIVSGNSQRAKVTTRLHPFVVQANDQYGRAMSEVGITFSTSGDGNLSQTRTTTDAKGQARTTLTLGNTLGTYSVTATATGTPFSQTFTAEATPRILSRLEVRGESHRSVYVGRWIKPLKVRILDTDNDTVEGEWVTFSVVSSGSTGTAKPLTREALSDKFGLATAYFMPSTPSTILIEATVADVPPVRFTLTASLPPAQLVKISGDAQTGDTGARLKKAFVVEALDKNGGPVSGATVKFAVTAGGGKLSTTSVTTDSNGRAQTTLTLGSQREGNSVRASISGVNPVVFSASIEPKVLVASANRPVMYWIDTGRLYRLTDTKPEKIAENVKGATIGDRQLYWTSQTGPSTGTINTANLDGSGAAVLTSILSVPIGIAVDLVDGQLYWTNSRGRIQRANLEGSGIQSVMENLSDPRDIVLHKDYIYWTESGDRIRRVNLTGQQVVQDVAVNLGNVGGLAVSAKKLYWTEATDSSAGTINRADLNGTNFKTLATILSVPMGMVVDPVENKLYWTNSRGRVQRANLNGTYIQNVVEDLMSPTTLVMGDEHAATAKTEQTQKDTTAAAPALVGRQLSAVEVDRIQEQIDLLLATNDRSPAAMQRLMYLQQLLTTARPQQTQLLANYPNPFNPETWIPYQLATDTEVRITIYNTQGVVIRTLHLGHQSAGYYTSRSRAAYWDGRNALGESVASGLYFYQLQADDRSQMRRMLILK